MIYTSGIEGLPTIPLSKNFGAGPWGGGLWPVGNINENFKNCQKLSNFDDIFLKIPIYPGEGV